MKYLKSVLVAFAALALVSGAATAQTYSVSDFSAVSNPNGVWSYGSIPSLGGPFTLLTDKLGSYYGLDHWLLDDQAPFYPAVVYNSSALPNTVWAINPLPAGAVGIHPSSTSDKGVIRFTSPTNAWYDLNALFDGLGGATVDVYIYHGLTELFRADINQNGGLNTAGYTSTLFIGMGETLDFIVGHGNNQGAFSHYYDGTMVAGTLTRRSDLGTQDVPEPGTLALLAGAGIAASVLVVRRRRA